MIQIIAGTGICAQNSRMAIVEVPIPSELAEELEESFYQGPMLNEHGLRMLNEAVVARINKIRIVIEADEQPRRIFT